MSYNQSFLKSLECVFVAFFSCQTFFHLNRLQVPHYGLPNSISIRLHFFESVEFFCFFFNFFHFFPFFSFSSFFSFLFTLCCRFRKLIRPHTFQIHFCGSDTLFCGLKHHIMLNFVRILLVRMHFYYLICAAVCVHTQYNEANAWRCQRMIEEYNCS